MNKLFITLYDFFERRRALLCTVLAVLVAAMGAAALQLRFSENITGFFPDGERKAAAAFSNLKIKDKIAVMINTREGAEGTGATAEGMMACADRLVELLEADTLFHRWAQAEASFGSELVDDMRAFLQGHLPLLLTEADYARMDTLLTRQGIARAMESNYRRLLSPVGGFIDEYIYDDPLGLSFGALGKLQELNIGGNYTLFDDYLFSKDMTTLMVFISPRYESSDTGIGDRLVERIEAVLAGLNAEYAAQGISADYFGAPAVAAYNARQIKHDMMLTLNIAILVIVVFITLSFRNKLSVLLALIPVALGGLLALAVMSLVCHTISAIAVGAGTVVMGIALSYSIHILCHANHCHDPRQIIRDLAYPLTIGSITTIGAFAGLLFTDSQLLRDFGLFASLTLVGTTLFSLVLLPHLIRKEDRGGGSAVLEGVERLTSMRPDRNRVPVAAILGLTAVCLFFFNRIGFDSDMMHLNYNAPHLAQAEERLGRLMDDDRERSKVLFLTAADTPAEAVDSYLRLGRQLDSLKQAGKIDSHAGVTSFVVDSAEQLLRLERWRKFWTPQRREVLRAGIREGERRYGFAEGAFDGALELAGREYTKLDYSSPAAREVFREWIDGHGATPIFLSHVTLPDSCKHEVYAVFSAADDIVVADRAFYAGKMARSVNHNFYLILSISSILVTVALFLCYGRIELTLMSLLPMGISWVIILGLMAMFGVEFNIVTIILSTFIFGIGDDFSIFIMDGLLSEYKTGRKMLDTHKTAIFFSAFTVVVGLGALIFARHPALHSLATISLFGIVAVVLVSYTIQPVLFRMLITSQTEKGGAPYTLGSLVNTAYAFGLFVTGCQLLQALIFTLWPLPMARRRKQRIVQWSIHHMTRGFLRAMVTTKTIRLNEPGERFEKPAVVIANHQSFIDILVLLSICPKAVMVTNGWVWRSPVFGRIVRYLGFYHAADGYERLAPALAQKVAEGYSVIVFPEGTRSADGKIGRFHKGAFYRAGGKPRAAAHGRRRPRKLLGAGQGRLPPDAPGVPRAVRNLQQAVQPLFSRHAHQELHLQGPRAGVVHARQGAAGAELRAVRPHRAARCGGRRPRVRVRPPELHARHALRAAAGHRHGLRCGKGRDGRTELPAAAGHRVHPRRPAHGGAARGRRLPAGRRAALHAPRRTTGAHRALRGTAQRRRTDHHPRRRQRQGRAAQGHGDDRGVVDEDRGVQQDRRRAAFHLDARAGPDRPRTGHGDTRRAQGHAHVEYGIHTEPAGNGQRKGGVTCRGSST